MGHLHWRRYRPVELVAPTGAFMRRSLVVVYRPLNFAAGLKTAGFGLISRRITEIHADSRETISLPQIAFASVSEYSFFPFEPSVRICLPFKIARRSELPLTVV
jgi:hypothetical protein